MLEKMKASYTEKKTNCRAQFVENKILFKEAACFLSALGLLTSSLNNKFLRLPNRVYPEQFDFEGAPLSKNHKKPGNRSLTLRVF
jgi:hypothetical protein